MVRKEDVQGWLNDSETLREASEWELKELADSYPYCEMLQWLYLKKLSMHDDVRFEAQLHRVGLQISNRRQLYFYLLGSTDGTASAPQMDQLGAVGGDYFSLMGNDFQRSSLQELAANLKAARLAKSQQEKSESGNPELPLEPVEVPAMEYQQAPKRAPQFGREELASIPLECYTEAYAVELIKNRCYADALKILEELNLKNPKKSTYFAIQIKFLQTILENNK